MPLRKGQSNAGAKNLIPYAYAKGKSGYNFHEHEATCVVCGKTFTTRGPWSKYCSVQCKEKSRPDIQKKTFVCEFCGKTFRRRAQNNAGRFCSRECSGLWTTANGAQTYVYKAFLHLPHRCEECGNDDFEVLVVHHRDRTHENNDISNLQILCANCHHRKHFGQGKTRRERVDAIASYLHRRERECRSDPDTQNA